MVSKYDPREDQPGHDREDQVVVPEPPSDQRDDRYVQQGENPHKDQRLVFPVDADALQHQDQAENHQLLEENLERFRN